MESRSKKAGDIEVGDQLYGGWVTKKAHIGHVVLVRLERRRHVTQEAIAVLGTDAFSGWIGTDAGVDFFDSGELVDIWVNDEPK